MRFYQPVGVLPQNVSINVNAGSVTNNHFSQSISSYNGNNFTNVTEKLKCSERKSTNKRSENVNNFDSYHEKETTLEDILKFKPNSKYLQNYLKSLRTDTKSCDYNNGNDDDVIFIDTLSFTGDNLLKFATSSPPTTPYDNCVTNQSYKKQNGWNSIQRHRRENLIKLDLESSYMTKHVGPMQVGDNSAGCSVESSPVDSLLDDQELLSPNSSSFADLSSPDTAALKRRYPRGIVNPNYPGFQHLAHTLAEHFIDHQFEQSSDSEISEDFDFDVAYRSGNLGNVNNMNDSNNNNDNINNNSDGPDKNIDLNRNKNRRSSFTMPESIVNDLGTMRESSIVMSKEYEDGNVNLMLKSEPKVFCESKQLDLHETQSEFERFSSEDEDEECCNLSTNHVSSPFTTQADPNQMDFDDDDLADLSGEDDAAIKNELENIDKADNDFNENINCDLAIYLQQYDFKMDVKKTYKYESERIDNETDEECLTDEDNSKLPTPDILIEHNSKKLQNSEMNSTDESIVAAADNDERKAWKQQCNVDEPTSDEMRDYQPDLIKNITDAINTYDNKQEVEEMTTFRSERMRHSEEGDNEISPPVEHETTTDNEEKTNDNDEKIINQLQTETVGNVGDLMEIDEVQDPGSASVNRNLPLSFESATSTTVDIIGDFGKEIEKEIGLIVSGYRNSTKDLYIDNSISGRKFNRPTRSRSHSIHKDELVFDENKFIEHLKCFSKMGDASLSNVEETIIVKNTLVGSTDRHESTASQSLKDSTYVESLIPTAIVKPKYQKLSFDERQLPVCGSTDNNFWYNPSISAASTTITTTPRKIQKHLPKTQKSFAKQTRKLVNRSGELCGDHDVSDKEAISSLLHAEKDIDCCVTQNSIAIVQPLKKVIDFDASVNMDDEKNQKPIESSKNSYIMSHKHEQKVRKNSKIIAANEFASRMNECGNNNLNDVTRKAVNIARESEKKVPTKKKEAKDNSDIFDVYNIETALPVIDLEAIESHLMAAKEEEQKSLAWVEGNIETFLQGDKFKPMNNEEEEEEEVGYGTGTGTRRKGGQQ